MSQPRLKKVYSKKRIEILLFILGSAVFMSYCVEAVDGISSQDIVTDLDQDINNIEEIELTPWTPEPEPPAPECIECKWYFCPPLSEVWKKEICFNICKV